MPSVSSGGGGHHGRRGRLAGGGVDSSLAEINVVPLVDVMLVMLIVFMVAAPMMQRGLDVNLPVARNVPLLEKERVFVTVPASYAADRRVQLNDEMIPVDFLEERMRQEMVTRSEKQVYLRSDGAITMQQMFEVMDLLKGAGVETVGMVAKLPGER